MVLLAEKRGEIGGDGVDQLHQLVAVVLLEQRAVVGKRIETELAQPAREPAVDQFALAVVQFDSGVRADELAEEAKVAFA